MSNITFDWAFPDADKVAAVAKHPRGGSRQDQFRAALDQYMEQYIASRSRNGGAVGAARRSDSIGWVAWLNGKLRRNP